MRQQASEVQEDNMSTSKRASRYTTGGQAKGAASRNSSFRGFQVD